MTNENVTMEQILAAVNGINGKIDTIQTDIQGLKDGLEEEKKRQDETDKRFEKMEQVINEALEEEAKAAEQPAPAAKDTMKNKIKNNLRFIVPAGIALTAVGGAVAYAVYKNKSSASYVETEDVNDDVIDM